MTPSLIRSILACHGSRLIRTILRSIEGSEGGIASGLYNPPESARRLKGGEVSFAQKMAGCSNWTLPTGILCLVFGPSCSHSDSSIPVDGAKSAFETAALFGDMSESTLHSIVTVTRHLKEVNERAVPIVREYLNPDRNNDAWILAANESVHHTQSLLDRALVLAATLPESQYREFVLGIINNHYDRLRDIGKLIVAVKTENIDAELAAMDAFQQLAEKDRLLMLDLIQHIRESGFVFDIAMLEEIDGKVAEIYSSILDKQ